MAKYKEVKFEVKDEVGIITIDRPERRNALCRDVWASIGQILSDTWDDINVRVIILTGNDEEYKGGRAFSAGLDIKEMSSTGFKNLGDFLGILLDPCELMARYPKPIIAAINGYAYAGGLELTLWCDCAIAADDAVMGFWENRRGLASGVAFLLLPELIGMRYTKELLLTGKIISADDAYRMGLVNQVVTHDQLMNAAMEMALEMKKVAPLSHKWTKKWFQQGYHYTRTRAIGSLWEPFQELFHSEDVIEGFTSFMEGNREPKWKGK
ncbi:MAG: enoyl-CoA hydratase/isomerase family protein [Candidatus Thorarchaeota archaeon]